MKISIITCTWNSEPYLADSIASVLSQTFTNIEYIFVDGGSTDGTLERIASIKRPITLIKDVRGGISHAMNVGALAATGDVVAHLHSDDFYLNPDVLSLVVNVMSNNDVGWCFGRVKRLKDGVLSAEGYVAPAYSAKRLLRRNFIPHPATFVRRDWIIEAGLFSESLKYAMDYDLWLKLAKRGDATELCEAIAAFREHAGSLSSSNRLAAMEEDYRVRLTHCNTNMLEQLEHRLRFFVRHRRIAKEFASQQAGPPLC